MDIISSNGRKIHLSQSPQEISDILNILCKRFCGSSKQAANNDNKEENSKQKRQRIEELPALLQKMSIMNFKGQVYSGNCHSLFTWEFGKCAVLLLSIFISAITPSSDDPKETVTIELPGYQIKDAIEWIESIEKSIRESCWF